MSWLDASGYNAGHGVQQLVEGGQQQGNRQVDSLCVKRKGILNCDVLDASVVYATGFWLAYQLGVAS